MRPAANGFCLLLLLSLINRDGSQSEARQLTFSPSPSISQSQEESDLLEFASAFKNFEEVSSKNNFSGWTRTGPQVCSGGVFVSPSNIEACNPSSPSYESSQSNPWTGVTCHKGGGVACIQLQHLGLSGTVSAIQTLGGLSNLSYLNVASNKLTGTLPADLGEQLDTLRVLQISNNQLTGTLGQDWGSESSFAHLEQLDLSGNTFYGTLPSVWGDKGRWLNLQTISFVGNHMHGTIPGSYEVNATSWTSLQSAVFVPGNQFCGTVPNNFPAAREQTGHNGATSHQYFSSFNSTCNSNNDAESNIDDGYFDNDGLDGSEVAGIITVEVLVGVFLLIVSGFFHRRYRWRQERSWVLFDWDMVQETKPRRLFPFCWRTQKDQDSDDWGLEMTNPLNGALSGAPKISADGGGLGGVPSPPSSVGNGNVHQNGDAAAVPVPAKKWSLPQKIWQDSIIRPDQIQLQEGLDGSPKQLGVGSFGKVYKGVWRDQLEVAVKVFEGYTGQQQQDTLLKEITILRSCRDLHVVKFYGVAFQKDDFWMVMELMEGNLFRHLARGHYCTWYFRGRNIALDIAQGMQFLHSQHIIHMDLKSPNILLGKSGMAKIADVGLARFTGSDSIVNQMVAGTMHWMAPEVLVHGTCTEKADIFSFGVILWEICTAESPTRGRMTAVSVPEECPQEVADLIDSCMEEDPMKRPSASSIIETLQSIPITSRPVPEPPWYAR